MSWALCATVAPTWLASYSPVEGGRVRPLLPQVTPWPLQLRDLASVSLIGGTMAAGVGRQSVLTSGLSTHCPGEEGKMPNTWVPCGDQWIEIALWGHWGMEGQRRCSFRTWVGAEDDT